MYNDHTKMDDVIIYPHGQAKQRAPCIVTEPSLREDYQKENKLTFIFNLILMHNICGRNY